jgi:hypothetical protein
MDTKEKDELAQEQMDQLKEALKDYQTVNNMAAVSGTHGYETITVNTPTDTITLSGSKLYNNSTIIGGGYTVTTGLGSNSTPYYTMGSTSGINWGAGTGTTTTGKLKLEGNEADIEINGVSLLEVLRDRLNVMIPNPELEKEWAQLKELGDQYRALEADIKEKTKIWTKLKEQS